MSQSLAWWGTLDARKAEATAQAEAAGHDFDALRLTSEAALLFFPAFSRSSAACCSGCSGSTSVSGWRWAISPYSVSPSRLLS
jgi:hypothetical protein